MRMCHSSRIRRYAVLVVTSSMFLHNSPLSLDLFLRAKSNRRLLLRKSIKLITIREKDNNISVFFLILTKINATLTWCLKIDPRFLYLVGSQRFLLPKTIGPYHSADFLHRRILTQCQMTYRNGGFSIRIYCRSN